MTRAAPLLAAAALAVLLLPLALPAAASPRPVDTHPPTSTGLPTETVSPGIVTQVGEVVVLEGDEETVTTLGDGAFGIDPVQQLPNITQRFYLHYPDEFDGIAVFTSFPDLSQGGAAYSVGPGAGTQGIGFAGSGAGTYGSQGRLVSVINMNDTAGYGAMDADDQWFLTVFGQEFAHSWLSYIEFEDPETGQPSSALLGRDGSHWSAVFDSGSSVMDGVSFTDEGDGTFTCGPFATRYGPLDLYAMGILAPDEVGPMFLLRDARYASDGALVDPVNDGWRNVMRPGRVVQARRVDFTIDDVVAAMGPRMPAWDDENEDFRVAVVLVTAPGESAEDVRDRAEKLDAGRLAWEDAHTAWADRRSTMCTDVSAPCPLAKARIEDVEVGESPDHGDGDGVIEPGERALVLVTLRNDGTRAASAATLELSSETPGVVLPDPAELPEIPVDGVHVEAIDIEIDGEACGELVEVGAAARIEHRQWKGQVTFRPGVLAAEPDPFVTDSGWVVDAGRGDTATTGAWEHAVPEATFFAGRTLQPDGGAGGAGDPAWFTGPLDRWDQGEVGGGATSLTSQPYDLSGQTAPYLRYTLWYLALDRTPTALTPSPEEHLVVQASSDGGATWISIDAVSGEPQRWVEREVALEGLVDTSGELLVRFVAADPTGADERLVEVGIDDVAIVSLSASCRGGDAGRCGCGAAGASGGGLPAIVAIWLLARRRRGRERNHPE